MRTVALAAAALAGSLLAGPACRTPHPPPPTAPPAVVQADSVGLSPGPSPSSPDVSGAPRAEQDAPLGQLLNMDAALLATDLTEKSLDEAVTLPAAIFYFSTGCPHCWNVAPEFQAACEALAGQGVHCVAIASSSSRLGPVREFAEQTGLGCPALVDYAGGYRDANGMTSTPTVLYVDEGGTVVHRADPFFRGASLGLRMAVARDRGTDPNAVWGTGGYVGSRACAACHEEAYNSWLLSPHAVAIRRLPGDTHEDPACLACHATAAGREGGFEDMVATGHLRDVGCEACHGPSGGHRAEDHAGERADPRESCTACHDGGHTLAFDLPRALPLIDHGLAGSLPREQWNGRRLDMEEGRFERSALAITPGPCAGSASCAACHADEHASWAAGPHGKALDTLREAASHRDPSCLACHTARTVCGEGGGRTKEPGVACEACHGPGGAHVDSGGQTGLGGVGPGHAKPCVVEPVCRSCHTDVRDPGWALEARLAGVHP